MAFNLYLHSLPWHSYWHSCSQSDVSAPGRYMYNCLCVQHSGAYSCRKYWPRVRHVRSNRTVCTNPALACATVIWLLTMVAHKILSAQVQAARARVALLSHTFAHITRVRDNITAQAAPPLLLIPPPASLASGRGGDCVLFDRRIQPRCSRQACGRRWGQETIHKLPLLWVSTASTTTPSIVVSRNLASS